MTGLDDDLYEGAESAQLAITSSDIAVLFSSPSPTIDVEIVDNDCEYITWTVFDCLTPEENGRD